MAILLPALLKRLLCCLLIVCIAGCISFRPYPLDQQGNDLPIEAGDEIRIIEKNGGRQYRLIVTDLQNDSITGTLVSDPGVETTVRREDILHLEIKRFDSGKFVLYTGLVLLTLYAISDLVGDIFDGFGNDD